MGARFRRLLLWGEGGVGCGESHAEADACDRWGVGYCLFGHVARFGGSFGSFGL
jgi:hypothetical protein